MAVSFEAALRRAGEFVAREGAELDRVYLSTLLRERDATALLSGLAGLQRDDGAIADWRDGAIAGWRGSAAAGWRSGAVAEDAAGEASTLRALSLLDALGLLDHPVPEAAAAFLIARQGADGGWGAAEDSAAARIARTGEAGGLLAKSPFARPAVLRAAERFLAERWSVEALRAGGCAAILAHVHLLAAFPAAESEIADEALQWCGRELERGFRSGAFSAVEVAQVFCRARARALPGARIEAAELAAAIATAQQPDGGWPAPNAAPQFADALPAGAARLDAALLAVEALLRLG